MKEKSITAFGDFGPAAKVLVQRVSDAVAGYAKPWQTLRVAKAEATAAKIAAVTDIEISEMQQRALTRILIEEERNQANIEGVVQKALPNLNDDASPEKIDDDWLARFFEECRIVSDGQMQSLWARILAGEANVSGSFQKRTLRVVSDLNSGDAEMFTSLCRFIWKIDGKDQPMVFDDAPIYTDNGIDLSMLLHLADTGLSTVFGWGESEKCSGGRKIVASYRDTAFLVSSGKRKSLGGGDEDASHMELGPIRLTQAGTELAAICHADPVEGLADYVTQRWRSSGLTVKPKLD